VSNGQDQAADPLEAARRYLRGLQNVLRVIDQVNPAAESITFRMRGTIETLNVDLGELKFFTTRSEK
jgi:hypothetical protein